MKIKNKNKKHVPPIESKTIVFIVREFVLSELLFIRGAMDVGESLCGDISVVGDVTDVVVDVTDVVVDVTIVVMLVVKLVMVVVRSCNLSQDLITRLPMT